MTGRMVRAAALMAALAFAACGGDEEQPRAAATPTATPTPTPTATATPPPPAPKPRKVRFKATDGARVDGQYVAAGRAAPAVVLLHEIRGGPDQWDPLIPYLHDRGFATLAYKSRPSPLEKERAPDALGAIRWLRERHDHIGLVGASIGASTTVYLMATGAKRTADAAVALSPPDSADIWALQDEDRYAPHDVLFVSDDMEASSIDDGMIDGAVRSRAMRSEEPGHGVALLPEQGVRDALLDWLDERVG